MHIHEHMYTHIGIWEHTELFLPARLSPLGAFWQAQESLLPFDSVAALSLPATLVQLSFKSAEQNSGLNFLTKPPHSIVPKKERRIIVISLKCCSWPPLIHTWSLNPSHTSSFVLSRPSNSSGLEKEGWHIPTDTPCLICSCSCTFLYLALTFSRPNPTVLMQGNLFGSQHRTASPESKRTDFFGVPAEAGHSHFLTSCITSALCSQMSEAAP